MTNFVRLYKFLVLKHFGHKTFEKPAAFILGFNENFGAEVKIVISPL